MPKISPKIFCGFCLIFASLVASEIFMGRIMSVRFMNAFSFVAITVVMFGSTLGPLILAILGRFSKTYQNISSEKIAKFSLVFSLFTILPALLATLFFPIANASSAIPFGWFTVYLVILTVPFIFITAAQSAWIAGIPSSSSSIYSAGLIGGGFGALLIILTFEYTNPISTIFLLAGLIALGSLLIGLSLRVSIISICITCAFSWWIFGNAIKVSLQTRIIHLPETAGEPINPIFEDWNSFSRVRVYQESNGAFGWGLSNRCHSPLHLEKSMPLLIDRTAGTPILNPIPGQRIASLDCDVTNAQYQIRQNGNVFIVGIGGGRDIRSALQYNAKSVTAAEINGLILNTLKSKNFWNSIDLFNDSRISIVHSDARSVLENDQTSKYDVIHISLVDTFAAAGSSAFSLTENSLYTVEAWQAFLNNLTNSGILSVSRWHYYDQPPIETWRTLSLAKESLQNIGVNTEDIHEHVAVAIGGNVNLLGHRGVANVMVKRTKFTQDEREQLSIWANQLGFFMLDLNPANGSDPIRRILQNGSDGYSIIGSTYGVDISPPTDNKPFFFLIPVVKGFAKYHRSFSLYSEGLDIVRNVLIAVGIAFAIIISLIFLSFRETAIRMNTNYSIYFSAIGFGFMSFEIYLLNRTSLLLSSPVKSLSIVILSLLCGAGIGALYFNKLNNLLFQSKSRISVFTGLIVAITAIILLAATIVLLLAYRPSDNYVNLLIAISTLFFSIPLGFPFVAGMQDLNIADQIERLIYITINSMASILGSVVATWVLLNYGAWLTLFMALFSYLTAVYAYKSRSTNNRTES